MNDKHNDVVTIGVALLVIIALVIDEVDKIHFSKEFSINIWHSKQNIDLNLDTLQNFDWVILR